MARLVSGDAVVLVLEARVVPLLDALGEDVRVEGRLRAEAEHLAGLDVHDGEGAAPGAAGQRLLAGLLHVQVHRQAQLAALLRVLLR